MEKSLCSSPNHGLCSNNVENGALLLTKHQNNISVRLDDEGKSPQGKVVGEEKEEESSCGWTEILAGYSDYVRGLELDRRRRRQGVGINDNEEDDSMVSDAGSGPEWRLGGQQQMMINSNNNISSGLHLLGGGMGPNYMLRKLDFNKSKRVNISNYDDSLEDTASSPVNSPKITMVLKKMDLNARRNDYENMVNFNDICTGEGRS